MARFCENCGAQLNEGANFCSSCGKRLNSGSRLYETFLRREGRLNRWSYFKRTMLAVLIEGLAVFVAAIVLAIFIPNEIANHSDLIATILFVLVIFLNYYLTYGLIIRRCHDLRENSLLHTSITRDDTSVAKFIIVGSAISCIFEIFGMNGIMHNLVDMTIGIVSIYLIFAPGEIGRNKYGARD